MVEYHDTQWNHLNWWVRLYAWLSLVGVIYGVIAAHLPFLLGYPWSTCEVGGWRCKLMFHLLEVPLSAVFLIVFWYGIWRFRKETILNFLPILFVGIASNLAFFVLEGVLILNGLWKSAPSWEFVVLFVITLFTAFGIFLGLYITVGLVAYAKKR